MKKVLVAAACIAVCVVTGLGIWQTAVHIQSKKYDLLIPCTEGLPPQVEGSEEKYVQLSEVNMCYNKFGSGEQSVVLIHGNGSSRKRLFELASYLADEYTVYTPDSRCHGNSTDTPEITYRLMAKDIKEFCEALGLNKPYIVGHSDGGINVLSLASMYPALPGAIVSCGANSHPKTFKPYFTAKVKIDDFFKKDKLNTLMLTLPDFTQEELEKIKCPAYIVAAEFDIMWLSDSVYIHNCVKNSRFSIVQGANHSSYITSDGRPAYFICKSFFDSLKNQQNTIDSHVNL